MGRYLAWYQRTTTSSQALAVACARRGRNGHAPGASTQVAVEQRLDLGHGQHVAASLLVGLDLGVPDATPRHTTQHKGQRVPRAPASHDQHAHTRTSEREHQPAPLMNGKGWQQVATSGLWRARGSARGGTHRVITMPGVQKPHWVPLNPAMRLWIGWNPTSLAEEPSPSVVVTALARAATAPTIQPQQSHGSAVRCVPPITVRSHTCGATRGTTWPLTSRQATPVGRGTS